MCCVTFSVPLRLLPPHLPDLLLYIVLPSQVSNLSYSCFERPVTLIIFANIQDCLSQQPQTDDDCCMLRFDVTHLHNVSWKTNHGILSLLFISICVDYISMLTSISTYKPVLDLCLCLVKHLSSRFVSMTLYLHVALRA